MGPDQDIPPALKPTTTHSSEGFHQKVILRTVLVRETPILQAFNSKDITMSDEDKKEDDDKKKKKKKSAAEIVQIIKDHMTKNGIGQSDGLVYNEGSGQVEYNKHADGRENKTQPQGTPPFNPNPGSVWSLTQKRQSYSLPFAFLYLGNEFGLQRRSLRKRRRAQPWTLSD